MIFPGRFYTSCVIHAQEETFSCSANGSNPDTAVWAVLTNHQTKINNDQNDLSSMPKWLRLLTDDTRYRWLPLVNEILLATTVLNLRQELYLVNCKRLLVTRPKYNRPVNSSEKRKRMNKLSSWQHINFVNIFFLLTINTTMNGRMNGSSATISRGPTG